MVKVGTIINTRGLKGEVKIDLSTDEPEARFARGNVLYLNEKRPLTVQSAREYKGFYYVLFQEIKGVDQAEKLKDSSLWIDESALPALDEDEFYYRATCLPLNQARWHMIMNCPLSG